MGYTAAYKRSGNVITITNTAELLQTGQLIWPIPILAAAGLTLFVIGFALTGRAEKKSENPDA